MVRGTSVVIIRSLMALLLAGLGVASLAYGRTVIGLLLLGLAATRVALTVVMYRRRRQRRERFQGRRPGGQDHLLVG
jgi:hypothetical protein